MDVRNEQHNQDQGTLRVDRVFDNGDSAFARYSIGSETGFMPQNLPGFGAFHDNLSQNANISWNRVITPNLLNTASVAYSRLSIHRFSENNYTNDIVSQQFKVSASAGRAPTGRRSSTCKVTRHSAIVSWPRRCTRGTRSSKAAIR